MTTCSRCGGSVIVQRFVEPEGRGTRLTCLACADMREAYDGPPPPTRKALRDIAHAPDRRANRSA